MRLTVIARCERGSPFAPHSDEAVYSLSLQTRERIGLEPLVLVVPRDVYEETRIGSQVEVAVSVVRS